MDAATIDVLVPVAVSLGMVAALIALITGWRLPQSPDAIDTNLEGAKQALADAVDSAKWMSGIQTATLAGLAWLLSPDGQEPFKELKPYPMAFALGAFIFNGAGLFCCAWVLSAASSISLRIHALPLQNRNKKFDVHETTIYAAEKIYGVGTPRLGNVMAVHHWCWSGGLIAFGLFVLARLLE